MAQTGILDYKRYLNTLQTLTNLGQTFPSSQQTYNFNVVGGSTAAWPATISWLTLVVDKVTYSSQATGYIPNVDDSQVVGYFDGGTATQYSTGVISLPANMYTGPILPGGDFNVPITVVHIEWFDGVTTYAQQIGFIQNWEPGVEIGDPTLDFDYHPVYGLPSTLTLTGDAGIVFGDNLVLTATTDMATDLGVNQTRVRFYRESTGTNIVLGTSFFTGTSATLVVPTDPTLPIGVYNIYAISQARGPYATATSNNLNVRVEAGVPLIVTTSTFTPNKAFYFPNDNVRYDLGVVQDPAFTATGVAISNPISIKLIDGFTPFTETNILNSNFVNGQTSANFNVVNSMIDLARHYPQTQYSITTSTQNATQYTATLFVYNTETVESRWGYQTLGRYRGGSTSTSINVGTSTEVTVTGQEFPLTIIQTSTSTYFDETFSVTVNTNTATYYANISVIAELGSTSTVLYSGNNSGQSSFTLDNLLIDTTGTWTIYATYPGDLGSSLINANLPSTSNSLQHIVRRGNDLLPTPFVTLDRNLGADVVRVMARTATTLTNTVTFLYNVIPLGTSTWERMVLTTVETTSTTKVGPATIAGGGMERNFDSYRRTTNRPANGQLLGAYQGWYSSTASYDIFTTQPTQNFNRTWKWDSATSAGGYPKTPWSGKPDVMIRIIDNDTPRRISPDWYSNQFGTTYGVPASNWINFSSQLNFKTSDKFVMSQTYNTPKFSENAKLVNPFRLFKYYNGSNYDLSLVTGTNISEILDPITTGTIWTIDFVGTTTASAQTFNMPSVIHAPVNAAPPGTPAGAGALSRLYDYVQDGSVQVDLYDIYRTDTIGTEDGYNVIGLASDFYGDGRLDMTEVDYRRLYFRVPPYQSRVTGTRYNVWTPTDQTNSLTRIVQTPVKQRYIDLVEYIGEVEWEKPIENAAQKAGTQPRSTIKVKLFRFTPTIPQTNTEFKTNAGANGQELTLPDPITTSTYVDGSSIPNGGFRIVKFSTSLNRSQDIVRPTEVLPAPQFPAKEGPALPVANNGRYYTTFAWIDNWQDPTTGAVKNDTFKLNGYPAVGQPLDIQNWPIVAGSGNSSLPYSTIEDQRYSAYGQKYWESEYPGNATYDNLAEFYNEWAMAFGFGQQGFTYYQGGTQPNFNAWGNETLISFDPDYVTTTTYSYPTERQLSTLSVSPLAIPVDGDLPANLHSKWPGTLSLPLEYGRFNPFDIYILPTRPSLDYLVVGGGGAGGLRAGGHGGGAGGMVTGTTDIVYGEQYEIVIGQGGLAFGSTATYTAAQAQTIPVIASFYSGAMSGKPSSFGDIVALGGGAGGASGYSRLYGADGGSGGGGVPPGQGETDQGNDGGTGINGLYGGGGGAGTIGADGIGSDGSGGGGAGGAGLQWFDENYYAGGGGGSATLSFPLPGGGTFYYPAGAGGVGGGGAGGVFPAGGTSGIANTGGGGGGSGSLTNNGGGGGSGIVIVRTLKTEPIAYTTNAIITEVGDYRYYKWIKNGSIIF